MTAAAAEIKRQLLSLPTLPILLREAMEMLEAEREKRNAFYEWITPDVKAEFINGEIVEHSPATEGHNETSVYTSRITSIFVDIHDLGTVRYEKAMISLTRNDYEPDIVFWKKSKASQFKKTQTHYPAPDWVVEILSDGTARRDRGVKFEDYAAHGIEEYWIIDTDKKIVEQYLLEGDSYELYKKLGIEDHIESKAIEGFAVPVAAIFDKEANRIALARMMG